MIQPPWPSDIAKWPVSQPRGTGVSLCPDPITHSSAVKILLVDDHPLFRGGLKYLLQSLDEHLELDEAGNCAQAEALASQRAYDLVLVDLKMPGVGGLDALTVVRAAFPATPVVVVSGEDDPAVVRAAIECGAMGFIPKSSTPEVMIQALKLVLAHGIYLPPRVLAASQLPEPTPSASASNDAGLTGLSVRQM